MTTLSPEARADLALLQRQTAEVRRAVTNAQHLALLRQQTVIRLRDRGVTYRTIAAAMGSSIAAVQSILSRAEVRVTEPAAPTVMTTPTLGAGGVVGASVPASTRAGVVGGAGVLGAGTTLKAGIR